MLGLEACAINTGKGTPLLLNYVNPHIIFIILIMKYRSTLESSFLCYSLVLQASTAMPSFKATLFIMSITVLLKTSYRDHSLPTGLWPKKAYSFAWLSHLLNHALNHHVSPEQQPHTSHSWDNSLFVWGEIRGSRWNSTYCLPNSSEQML